LIESLARAHRYSGFSRVLQSLASFLRIGLGL
jgi:hypothetical protein